MSLYILLGYRFLYFLLSIRLIFYTFRIRNANFDLANIWKGIESLLLFKYTELEQYCVRYTINTNIKVHLYFIDK